MYFSARSKWRASRTSRQKSYTIFLFAASFGSLLFSNSCWLASGFGANCAYVWPARNITTTKQASFLTDSPLIDGLALGARNHIQSPPMFGKRLNPKILYIIFFLSGATGLVYEVIWVRLTGLVFGNTSHAISTVLGAFMAGLALGSWKLGQQADRIRNPLRMYGLLEIGIGISAALVPLVFRALDSFYWAIAPFVASIT